MKTHDRMARTIIGVSIALALLTIAGLLAFGGLGFAETRRLIELPWVQPTTESFIILSTLAIATLFFGRYRAIGGAWSNWAGMLFLANCIFNVFYLLSWPGLVGEGSLIAQLSNTATWLAMTSASIMPLLLVAVQARRPERLPPSYVVAGYVAAATGAALFCALSVVFEQRLPSLIIGLTFTSLDLGWMFIILVGHAAAALLTYRQYAIKNDPMLGYLALFLVLLDFGLLFSVLGGRRYDIWWYVGHFTVVASEVVMLFGFLQEGYNLFAKEHELALERERLLQQVRDLADVAQRQADELIEATKELESFSYSISHDLRAPLRAIDSYAHLVQDEHGKQLDAEAMRSLNIVRENARQMGRLIDGLLAFTHMNRQPINPQHVNSLALVQETLADLERDNLERHIDIRVGDLPDCEGDRHLLKLVWSNLLSNAFKFTARRESAAIEVGCAHKDGEDVFVWDNGAGFDMQYAGKLFGVFQKLHRQEDFEGIGVGLAIVRRILHRHGGRVWAEGAVDRGATFYFTV